MVASLTDKFRKVGASTVTTLAAPGKALAAASITVGSTTNYPTDTGIVIGIREVDTNGELVAGTYTEWNATVSSATSFNISTTPRLGSDRVYPAASTTQVFLVVSSSAHNDLIDGILEEHGQDGGHTDITADSITAPTGTITNLTVTSLTVGSQTPSADWTTSVAPNTVTYNGNRSYDLVFNGTNLTTAINPGTRLRTTRTVSAPTQCTSLNGTNQYYSKTSPAGMTFTDDFVVSAWVKLTAYGSAAVIASRYNGTSGWTFNVETTGQLTLQGNNGGSSNLTGIRSYQSIPLNKWIHVTAQLDMSTLTNTATTNYVMFDGVDVPAFITQGGTNPTALIQAGNLEIGSRNSGTLPWPGKIAQVAIFNAKVTQATIRGYISQGLAGTETSLISAYSFNNSITDLNTTNANNLTANGSAVATNADSPFGGQASGSISSTLDYSIVQSASFSTNTTLVVQVPEGCTIPTSGGVSAVSYSSAGKPYGMPVSRNKFRLSTILKNSTAVTSNATYGAFASGGFKLPITTGEWNVGWQSGATYNATTTTVYFAVSPTDLTGLSAANGGNATRLIQRITSPSASDVVQQSFVQHPFTVSTLTNFTMYTLGSTTGAGLAAAESPVEIFAENAWL